MKVFICLLLLLLICAAFQATVWCLQVRSNLDLIQARVNQYGYEAGKMKDVVDWFENVPIEKKIQMIGGR